MARKRITWATWRPICLQFNTASLWVVIDDSGAPLLYYGDEYGEFGGADPDNRHMYREKSQWSNYESELFEKISEIGKIRLESDALRRGQYSTIHAEPDRLVYAMKSEIQEMNIILNRGGEWSWGGFDESYDVRYGETIINSDEIIVPKNSILIIEINSTHQNVSTEILGCMDICHELRFKCYE